MKKRVLSVLLILSLCIQMFPDGTSVTAAADSAEENIIEDCTHHLEHTEDCGYIEVVEGQPCTHVHTSDCGLTQSAEILDDLCDLDCIDEDEDGVIDHAEDCAYSLYALAKEGEFCAHEHDEACGYVEAVEGHPCEFVCAICDFGSVSDSDAGHTVSDSDAIYNYTVIDWTWVDPMEILMPASDYSWVEGVDWVLGIPMALEEEDILALLPEFVTGTLVNGETVELPLTWSVDSERKYTLPEEMTEGMPEEELPVFYLFTAELPEGYALDESAPELNVLAQMVDINPLSEWQPGLKEEDLTNATHFIVRYWHNEEQDVTFGNAGTNGKWNFVVAEGYIVPHATLKELNEKGKIIWGTHGLDDGHNYEFFIVMQDGSESSTETDATYISVDDLEKGLEDGKLFLLETADDSPYIAGNEENESGLGWENGVIILNAPDSSVESFAGYSISAGHSAATVSGENIEIAYDKYTHLVKSHAFYLNNTEKKPGSNAAAVFSSDNPEQDTVWGYTYISSDAEGHRAGDIVKYSDGIPFTEFATKEVKVTSADGTETTETVTDYDAYTGKPKLDKNALENIGVDPDNVQVTKIYSTTEGLHTDKSVEAKEGTDSNGNPITRQFDVELESWYTEGYAPQIAMALDASGSMVFAADTPSEIKLTKEQIEAINAATNSEIKTVSGTVNGSDWEQYFLTPEQLNEILDPHNTDNSPLGSGGYSYFVHVGDDDFQPLAYWEGVAATQPAAQLEFNKDLPGKNVGADSEDKDKRAWMYDKVTDRHGQKVDPQVNLSSDYEFITTPAEEISGWSTQPTKFSGTYGLQVARRDNEAGVLLDTTPSGGNFTLTFDLRVNTTGTGLVEMLYIGPMRSASDSGYVRLYCDKNNDNNELRISQSSDANSDITESVFVENKKIEAKPYAVTLVFQGANTGSGTVSMYIDGQLETTGTLEKPITEANVILAGVKNSYSYSDLNNNDQLDIDTFTLYNFAADKNHIASLGSTATPRVARAGNGGVLGTNMNSNTDVGWYFMNHGGDYDLFKDPGTAKRLYGVASNASFKDSYGTYTSTNNTPVKFYVDNEGYLHCFFMSSTTIDSATRSSLVYKLTDQQYIRTEAMQRAIGAFVVELNENFSAARLSAVRYSVDVSNNTTYLPQLVLLDWTSDPAQSLNFLSLKRGDGSALGTDTSASGRQQYNYGLTGSTNAKAGLTAYNQYLKDRAEELYQDAGKGEVPKYLIIFTDGDDADYNTTKKLTDDLKADDYTVFVVVLANTGVSNKSYTNLAQIAGKTGVTVNAGDGIGNDGAQYLFTTREVGADENIADALTALFIDGILAQIADPLDGFNVTDYIDPRFDLVVNDVTWYLGANGNVTIGDAGVAQSAAYGIEVPLSGKTNDLANNPKLHYDNTKDMYYLEWTGQKIPTCEIGATELTVWNAKFTIQAKEDFIGGNAVLTNGTEANMNWVYNPKDTDSAEYGHVRSSGTDDAVRNTKVSKTDPNYNQYPSKGFPRTSANVTPPIGRLDISQSIFMGDDLRREDITTTLIEEAMKRLADPEQTQEVQLYWEYIKRFVNFINAIKGEDPGITDSVNGLTGDQINALPVGDRLIYNLHTMNRLGNELKWDAGDSRDPGSIKIISNRLYDLIYGTNYYKGNSEHKTLSVETLSELLLEQASGSDDNLHYLYIPYFYLPDDINNERGGITNSTGNPGYYALDESGVPHLGDVLGYLLFQVTETIADENFYDYPNTGIAQDNWPRRSQLQITYEVRTAKDRADWNNSQAIQEKNQQGEVIYKRDADRKPAVGIEVTSDPILHGELETTIVLGKIALQVQITEEQLDALNKAGNAKYKAKVYRTYKGRQYTPESEGEGDDDIQRIMLLDAGDPTDETETDISDGTRRDLVGTISWNPTNSMTEGGLYLATFNPTDDYAKMINTYGFPEGTYTLETITSEAPTGYRFGDAYLITSVEAYKAVKDSNDDQVFDERIVDEENGETLGNYLGSFSAGDNRATLGGRREEQKDDSYLANRYALFRLPVEEVGDLDLTKVVVPHDDDCEDHPEDSGEFTLNVSLSAPTTATGGTEPDDPDDPEAVDADDPADGETESGGETTENTHTAEYTVVKVVDGEEQEETETVTFDAIRDTEGALIGLTGGSVKLKAGETIRIKELPAKWNFTVTEEDVSARSYVSKVDPTSGTITQAQIDDGYSPAFVTVTNQAVHSLTVNKTVTGSEADPEQTWKFIIELTDANGNPVNGTFGEYTFENGGYTTILGDGDFIVIEDIPCGVTYKVTEDKANQDGYGTRATDSAQKRTTYNGVATGSLTEDVTLAYVNSKPAGGIFISKTVISEEDADKTDKEFEFIITLSSHVNGEFTCTGSGAPVDGKITFTDGVAKVYLKHNETIHIEYGNTTPDGWKLKVAETEADYFETENTLTVTDYSNGTGQQVSSVTQNGLSAEATISGTLWRYEFDFTNERNTHSLTLSKTVSGNMGNRNDEFTFQITLTGPNSTTLTGTYSFTDPDGQTITFVDGVAEVKLKHGDTITIPNLPEGIEYKIVESDVEGYKTTVAATVTVQEDGKPKTETMKQSKEEEDGDYEFDKDTRTTTGVLKSGDIEVTYTNNRTIGIPTDATSENMWLIVVFLASVFGITLILGKYFGDKRRRCRET